MDECDDLILQGLDVGERDTIRLFRAGIGEIIILDDWKGASYCKNNAIPYINALLVPRILLLAGIISKSESEESMSRIVENGWYSQWVIDYARFCPDEKLLPFL
ncbi:MAG: hypothetical protein JW807_11150 [Spirochaetes bacterium]|nr:hypothetical protein [Spirochaetota bacterium]